MARQALGNPDGMTLEGQLQSTMSSVLDQLNLAMSQMHAFQAGQTIQSSINIETNWTKLYLQALYCLIMTPNSTIRYQGNTYRGMRLTLDELAQYQHQSYVTSKAITSTSKLRHVAQNFIDQGPRPDQMVDVMFIYVVDSYTTLFALDIHRFSLIPEEEEVLLMPGILFTVGQIKVNGPYSVEIEMRSAFQDMANGRFANLLSGLFSGLSSDLD